MSGPSLMVGINGAAGRLGRLVTQAVATDDICDLVCALERVGHGQIGADAGLVAGLGEMGVMISSIMERVPDVLVDFSTPSASIARVSECAEAEVPVVVCTTGFSEAQKMKLERAASVVPVLIASNVALGVNVFFRLAEWLADTLPDTFDAEIIEVHHRQKRDAPSGTAMELARRLCKRLDIEESSMKHGRIGEVGPRGNEEIGLHAVRGGDVAGEHTLLFAGNGERIEVCHRASSPSLFAQGALVAARFLHDKEPGLYTMADVLF